MVCVPHALFQSFPLRVWNDNSQALRSDAPGLKNGMRSACSFAVMPSKVWHDNSQARRSDAPGLKNGMRSACSCAVMPFNVWHDKGSAFRLVKLRRIRTELSNQGSSRCTLTASMLLPQL
jgi:hypothetical protein